MEETESYILCPTQLFTSIINFILIIIINY
jgi:hypothetical protein